MIRALISLYRPPYPRILVYMLQNTEYQPGPYLAWFWRTQDFSRVEYRRTLQRTTAARMLLRALQLGMLAQIIVGLLLLYTWCKYHTPGLWEFGLAAVVSYPLIWAHLIVVPLVLGRAFIVAPRDQYRMQQAEKVFKAHQAEKVAIVGSYGKTSMKEILLTVLSEGLEVAATPANKNVGVSHAAFARKLTGKEQVLLIEYGEGAPGDVARFAKNTHPTRAIITGIAAAHLDRYRSTTAAAKDIFSVTQFIADRQHVYVNADSLATKPFMKQGFAAYDLHGMSGWRSVNIETTIGGTSFTLRKGDKIIQVKSELVGAHMVGPLICAAVLAHELGMNIPAIEAGLRKTKPFEHRMQPYQLNGAWIIDDTYNGNIEGIRAGTQFLKALSAKRKIYVTPGLVDQGKEGKEIHETMGTLIANSGADVVVLMHNSTTNYIRAGLESAHFSGELIIEDNPLNFYKHLSQFVAAGDIALLQNDWPDNYR